MKRSKYNPAEFAAYVESLPLPKRRRVWQQVEKEIRQTYEEWSVFCRFASLVQGYPVRDNAVTLDPNSCQPPAPDIACSLGGMRVFVELGEVVEQEIARKAAESAKTGNGIFGGLLDLWAPLQYILDLKCRKSYSVSAKSLDLLLFYGVGRQAAFAPFLMERLTCEEQWIAARVSASGFRKVWLYDDHNQQVLAVFTGQGVFAYQPGDSLTS